MELPFIEAPSSRHRELAQAMLDQKTKPLRSLGRLEWVAAELAAIQGRVPPSSEKKRIILFAGDHGVTAEGVSAFPQEVTCQMLKNFAAGGAAVCVLAKNAGAEIEVVDVGSCGPVIPGVITCRAGVGTKSFVSECAMTEEQCKQAFNTGRERVRAASAERVSVLVLGEMGIGNTTSASALFALLNGTAPEEVVGNGTGVDGDGIKRKIRVLQRALDLHRDAKRDPIKALCAVGGFEIAALAGACLEAASRRIPVLVDGFIVSVAAYIAAAIDPLARGAMIFAHVSAERGHALVLKALDAEPLLALQMRLGEGSGAALALPILDAAVKIISEMSTFESAGVSTHSTGSGQAHSAGSGQAKEEQS